MPYYILCKKIPQNDFVQYFFSIFLCLSIVASVQLILNFVWLIFLWDELLITPSIALTGCKCHVSKSKAAVT